MKLIPLTRGYSTFVDDDDYENLARHSWHALITRGRVYAVRSIARGGSIYMHREIMKAIPGEKIDHREGVGLDNRKFNLRRCTHQQNLANRGRTKVNKSGRKGVCAHQGKWRAQIHFGGKRIDLGCYDDIEIAATKYIEKARELYGEFAKA